MKFLFLKIKIFEMNPFNDLKPGMVWSYFNDILQIPRPSKKEDEIIQYIKDFANKHNLICNQDNAGNVLIVKPAFSGFERKKTIVLQSHVDMVCEKNEEVEHNFDTDPIETFIEDGWIKAKGTTLGADNGIGVAIQLAILADQSIEHGPLECLFTVDEETGMTGAVELKEDFFSGKILINLDSEDEGEIYIGCAGGIDTVINLPVKYNTPDTGLCNLTIQVKGLLGGHSGDDIDKRRGNAIKIISRLLYNLSKKVQFNLSTIKGGNLRNAIPRESGAVIVYSREKENDVLNMLESQINALKYEFSSEPDLTINLEANKTVNKVINYNSQHLLINCLHACPNGVIEMCADITGLVETSTNLASVCVTEKSEIEIVTSQRSSVESAKMDIASRIRSLFEITGASISHTDSYPGWNPDTDSEILRIAENSYKRLFRVSPKVKAIHAGLECGLFLEKYPKLDMISIGPTIRGAHSPDERIEIKSVDKFWRLLLDILKFVKDDTY